jgi:MoxR-like ATPase
MSSSRSFLQARHLVIVGPVGTGKTFIARPRTRCRHAYSASPPAPIAYSGHQHMTNNPRGRASPPHHIGLL